MINLCAAIDCPFYKYGASSGCTRYPTAGHCHLPVPKSWRGYKVSTQSALYLPIEEEPCSNVLLEVFTEANRLFLEKPDEQSRLQFLEAGA